MFTTLYQIMIHLAVNKIKQCFYIKYGANQFDSKTNNFFNSYLVQFSPKSIKNVCLKFLTYLLLRNAFVVITRAFLQYKIEISIL